MKPFLDTNVLIYATLSDDPRRVVAERIFEASGTISVQVLNEFAVLCIKRARKRGHAILNFEDGK